MEWIFDITMAIMAFLNASLRVYLAVIRNTIGPVTSLNLLLLLSDKRGNATIILFPLLHFSIFMMAFTFLHLSLLKCIRDLSKMELC